MEKVRFLAMGSHFIRTSMKSTWNKVSKKCTLSGALVQTVWPAKRRTPRCLAVAIKYYLHTY